eukprot:Selendium_serpulae@DN2293_c0_g1_i1.p1
MSPSTTKSILQDRIGRIQSLKGSIVAIVTPMNSDTDRSLALDELVRLVQWHLLEGTHGIVVCGTTGEASSLSTAEWVTVVGTVIRTVDGRIPVIAGTGSNNTRTTIERTRLASFLGVDGALVVTPFYNKPPQEGLFQHFAAVAEGAPEMPIVLYNVPGRTGCDMTAKTVHRLAQIPSIVGIKEAGGKLERFSEISALCDPEFRVYSGEDGIIVDAIKRGAHGVISVVANVAPGLVAAMCTAALNGEDPKAEQLKARLAPLAAALFIESNPIPTKWALAKLTRIPGGIRLPLVQMSQEHDQAVADAMSAAAST